MNYQLVKKFQVIFSYFVWNNMAKQIFHWMCIAALLITGLCCQSVQAAKLSEHPLKVAFVYVGPIGDGGWTYSHELGRQALQREFGVRVETSYIEKVPAEPESEAVFRKLAEEGNQLIIGTTFGYMEPMLKVAKEFPNIRFLHATGYKSTQNLRTYESRQYEAAYLAGIVAGGMTITKIIGVVASVPIPEVIRNINAFTMGARTVNSSVITKVTWVDDWYNPPKEREAAEQLIRGGADILIQNTESAAVLQTVQRYGKKAFGWDSNMRAYAPGAHLGSIVNDWSPYYINTVRALLDNRWETVPLNAWYGVQQGMTDLVAVSDLVPSEVRVKVQLARAALHNRTFSMWKGPLYSNSGQLAIDIGIVPNDKWLSNMHFYVKGVQGNIPEGLPIEVIDALKLNTLRINAYYSINGKWEKNTDGIGALEFVIYIKHNKDINLAINAIPNGNGSPYNVIAPIQAGVLSMLKQCRVFGPTLACDKLKIKFSQI